MGEANESCSRPMKHYKASRDKVNTYIMWQTPRLHKLLGLVFDRNQVDEGEMCIMSHSSVASTRTLNGPSADPVHWQESMGDRELLTGLVLLHLRTQEEL